MRASQLSGFAKVVAAPTLVSVGEEDHVPHIVGRLGSSAKERRNALGRGRHWRQKVSGAKAQRLPSQNATAAAAATAACSCCCCCWWSLLVPLSLKQGRTLGQKGLGDRVGGRSARRKCKLAAATQGCWCGGLNLAAKALPRVDRVERRDGSGEGRVQVAELAVARGDVDDLESGCRMQAVMKSRGEKHGIQTVDGDALRENRGVQAGKTNASSIYEDDAGRRRRKRGDECTR